MKKLVILALLGLIMSFLLSKSGSLIARELIEDNSLTYQLTELEENVFDKLYLRDAAEANGYLTIDSMNIEDKPGVTLEDGTKIDYDFLANRLYTMDSQEKNTIKSNSMARSSIEKNQVFDLFDYVDTSSKLEDIKDIVSNLDWIQNNDDLLKIILPSAENQSELIFDSRQVTPQTSYYYRPVSYSQIESFDANNVCLSQAIQYKQYYSILTGTNTYSILYPLPSLIDPYYYEIYSYSRGINSYGETTDFRYSIPRNFYVLTENKFYEWNAGALGINLFGHHNIYDINQTIKYYERIYTGKYYYALSGSPQTYPHAEKIGPFSYLNWVVFVSPPVVNITLILDYFGNEKMIINSYDGELGSNYDYFITREVHWNRNQYNVNRRQPLTELYPYRGDLINQDWDEALPVANYFHRLMPANNNNKKFIKETTYFDLNLSQYTTGSFELIYSGDSSSSTVVTDSLVMGTFNFGTGDNFTNNPVFVVYTHYVRDVYPYLIWGNNQEDFNNHSAFERFVWDKDSAGIQDGQNLSGVSLTSKYPFPITDAFGYHIPTFISSHQGTGSLISDFHAPSFNTIATQQVVVGSAPRNWLNLITGETDNMAGNLTRILISNNVNYATVGTYSVRVGLYDITGNLFTRIFSVVVYSASGGAGGTGGGSNPPFSKLLP